MITMVKSAKLISTLKVFCNSRNIGFIGNENINANRHLNNTKLNKNGIGDAILASNFRNTMKNY